MYFDYLFFIQLWKNTRSIAPNDNSEIRFIASPCLGACDKAPVAADGHFVIPNIDLKKLQKIEPSQAIQEKNKSDILQNVLGLDSYIQSGGYEILRKLKNSNDSDKYDLALTQLENSALKGLGGAGFPTGKKWRIVKQQKDLALWL